MKPKTHGYLKLVLASVVLLLISMPSILAHGGGHMNFSAAESIIQQKIPCDQLTDDQLEMLGDYYMEQMHPGESHTYMDQMMGGEGSATLRDMHIRIAKAFYCGETTMYPEAFFKQNAQAAYSMMGGGFGGGMMGWFGGFGWLIAVLLIIVLILAIVLLGKAIIKG